MSLFTTMATYFPQRPHAHQLEDESLAFLAGHLPHGWTLDQPQHDYGVDVRIGLARGGQVNGQQLVVQLKASASAKAGDNVSIRLDVPTLHLLRNMLEVAMLVKYVANEQDAYWLLLKDFNLEPEEDQKSVTVRIPRANRISAQPWQQLAEHVAAVHYGKLHANGLGLVNRAPD